MPRDTWLRMDCVQNKVATDARVGQSAGHIDVDNWQIRSTIFIFKETGMNSTFPVATSVRILSMIGLLVALPVAAQNKVMIAKSNITTSAADGKNIGALAIDDNLDTHWTGEAAPGQHPWISLKLGSCQKVDHVRLAWFKGNERHYDYTIKASKDNGATWKVASAGMSNGLTSGRIVYEFPNTSATDIRLESTGNDSNEKVSLSELEVWSLGEGNCAAPTPSPPSPPSPPSHISYPADLFGGLNGWKLNQPTGPSNNADVISQPTLAKYAHDPYFTLNEAKTGVNFRAVAGGSRTSINTAYSRSELREMQSDNVTPAAWNCSSATRGMTLEQTLTHTTTHKAEGSIAQIHDDVNDNLMVKYFGPKYPKANGTSDTGTIRANFNNDASSVVLDGNYTLGDPMSIDVSVSGGTVSVLYRNRRSGITTQTPAVSFANVHGGCYFKAGMYIAACSKVDLNGNVNEACVKKGLSPELYETDPNAFSELEIGKINLR